jgi:lycopene cyclase domain-containing protein
MGYTWASVAGVVAVVVLELAWLRTGIFRTATLWIAYGIVVFFQVLVDGWLTKLSAPIVIYRADKFTGWRTPFDVPVEDYPVRLRPGHAHDPAVGPPRSPVRSTAASLQQGPGEQEQGRAADDDDLSPQGGQGQGREARPTPVRICGWAVRRV